MKKHLFIAALAAFCMTTTAMAQAPTEVKTYDGALKQMPALKVNRAAKVANNKFDAGNLNVTGVNAMGKTAAKNSPNKIIINAPTADYYGRELLVNLVNSTDWSNMSITQVPYGLYTFPMAATPELTAMATDMTYDFLSSAQLRDTHYGIAVMDVMGVFNGARYTEIDTKNWKHLRTAQVDPGDAAYSLLASVMAYDQTEDKLYGFQYKSDLTGLNWVRINTKTDEMEVLAAYRGKTTVLTLAADHSGQMYYIDSEGDLYTVNKKNGRTSLVGNTGVTPAMYNQSMAWDNKTNSFLWAAQTSNGSELLTVNPKTALARRVLTFKKSEQITSVSLRDNSAKAKAPAAVTRPSLKYTANGALTGNISFTVPKKTFDNASDLGTCNLNVWLDGENLKGEDVTPGTLVTIPVELEEGNHYIAITLDNETGYSPLRYIYQYAGYDTPVAPKTATFTYENNTSTVTWDAVTTGVNSGYIDAANVTYNIVRMPDNVVVAQGVKETTYTETTPNEMHNYYYLISAVNNGHEGAQVESNHIISGDAFPVPYKQEFEDANTLIDFYTVVDGNNDGITWRQGYTKEVRMDLYQEAKADDWLITPLIKLEAGKKYRYTQNMKIWTKSYPEDFEIYIGTDKNDLSTFKLIKSEKGFTDIYEIFDDYSCDFNITETGKYHLAIRNVGDNKNGSALIMINSISVEFVGNSLAPAQVSDMAIAADANDELKATLTFKAPAKNLQDQDISTLSKIEVFREGDRTAPIKTFETPKVGETLTFTDEAVPFVGFNGWDVIAYNAEGTGEVLHKECFVGCYAAENYSEDFNDRRYAELYTVQSNVDFGDYDGWKIKDGKMDSYYYQMEQKPTDIWLYSPVVKFDKDAVYLLSYDLSKYMELYNDPTAKIYLGTKADSTTMKTFVADMPDTSFNGENVSHQIVTNDAGKYHLGFNMHAEKQYAYFSMKIDNVAMKYLKSAFSPYEITNFTNVADATGEMKTTMTFNAPTINYQRNTLSADENITVNIYRGGKLIAPAFTVSVKPGEQVTWTDEQAVHGFNDYAVVAENKFGKSEIHYDTLFVGRDVAPLISTLAIRGSKDNKDAIMTWEHPTKGENGGVIINDEMTYNIYSYDVDLDTLYIIEENVKGTSYTITRNEQTDQMKVFYAIAGINTEGCGNALAQSIVLGKLYDLPFKESFAKATLSTTLWQMVSAYSMGYEWNFTNPGSNSYNGCMSAQDKDGGCAYMYNGAPTEQYNSALLVTPKMAISPADTDIKLTFWTYNYKSQYSYPGTVSVGVSNNDTPFELFGDPINVSADTEKGWTKHTIDLSQFRNSDFISLAFLGMTGGYMEVIYLDNVEVTSSKADGIEEIETVDSNFANAPMYNIAGQRIEKPRGIVIKGGKKVMRF